jgi:YVTN family beta-propeller protein
MVALYRSGRQAEALDAYRAARTALRDELGLEPSEELLALQRAVLDHDPALAAPPRVDLSGGDGESRPPEGRKLRRPLLAVALGLVILGGVAAALALTLGANKAAPIVVPPNSVAMVDENGKKVESYVAVGRHPTAVAVGEGGVWVANSESGTVTRLDPATGKFVDTIGVGADPNDIAVGLGSVWVADGNDGTVTQIDPSLNQVGSTIPSGGQSTIAPDPVFYVAVDSSYVWATRGSRLLRIDPHTLHAQVWAKVGSPTGLATGGGYVWVTTGSGNLLRIDSRTPNNVDAQPLIVGGVSPVYARGSVWLIVGPDVVQFYPTSLTPGKAIPVKGSTTALAAGNDTLWAVTHDGSLVRLPLGGGDTIRLPVGRQNSLSDVAAGAGATWVAVSARG